MHICVKEMFFTEALDSLNTIHLFKQKIQSYYICFANTSGSQCIHDYTVCFVPYLKFYLLKLNKSMSSKTVSLKRGHRKVITNIAFEVTCHHG